MASIVYELPLFYQSKHHEVTHDIYNTSKKYKEGLHVIQNQSATIQR